MKEYWQVPYIHQEVIHMKSFEIRQFLFLILIFLAFLLVISALIYTGSAFSSETLYAEQGAGGEAKKNLIQFQDDVIVKADERIDGDVYVREGDIIIKGRIYGDVIVVQGDVEIDGTAEIYGNIICYGGDVVHDEQAMLGGDIITINEEEANIVAMREFNGLNFDYHLYQKKDTLRIRQDETLYGDLILVDNDAEVSGKIDGDIYLLTGSIKILSEAAVDGHVLNYSGVLNKGQGALVTGIVITESAQEDEVIVHEDEEEDDIIRDEVESKYLKRTNQKDEGVVRFFGDVIIEADERIVGDVVIMKGSAVVKGEIDGDIVAIFGNIELDSTGYVMGDVVSVGGKIYREKDSYVGGDVVQTTWTGARVNDTDFDDEDRREDRWHDWDHHRWYSSRETRWDDEDYIEDIDNGLFRYNRVEGLFLGVQVPKNQWLENSRHHVKIYGHAGYGFKSKRGLYQVGLERWIFDEFRFSVGIETHDMLDTEDKWVIPEMENSLAALFLREDFRDYYRRSGTSAYAIQNITRHFRVKAGLRKDRFYSMTNKTNWSIFGGDKKFHQNPAVDELEFKSIFAHVGLDTRDHLLYPNEGWFINVNGEFARPEVNKNSNIDFDRLTIDLRRYQPIGYGENLDFRFRLGTSRGLLPIQYLYDLGGISSLRGYDYKEFKDGDRMVLGNVEYRIYGSFFDLFDFSELNIILFADAGWVWTARDNSALDKSFDYIRWDDMMTDVGVALSNYEGNVRVNFAQRLDDRDKPVVITFRISKAF